MASANLTPEERLIWLLGDLMDAAENYFGAANPKRSGHINSAAIRIIDEVIAPIKAQARAEALDEAAIIFDKRADIHARDALWADQNLRRYEGEPPDGVALKPMNGPAVSWERETENARRIRLLDEAAALPRKEGE